MNFSPVRDILSFFYIVPVSDNIVSVETVPDYIGNAIIYFFLFIILEYLYGRWKNVKLYGLKDTIMSLSLGVFQQIIGVWSKEIGIVPYTIVYSHFAPFRANLWNNLIVKLPFAHFFYSFTNNNFFWFIIGLMGCDLGYYFFHRFAHEYHLLWIAHSVHHSGERYNLATALRQGAWQSLFSWIMYLPLAIVGLPSHHYLRHTRLNTLFQFWIHTETIGTLWTPIELIFNTASHHRLHHRPPGNCNYCGIFILWDRLFGTFASEVTSKPNLPMGRSAIYGLAQPLDSFRPIFANVKHIYRLFQVGRGSFMNRVQYVLSMIFSLKNRAGHQYVVITDLKKFFPELFFQNYHG